MLNPCSTPRLPRTWPPPPTNKHPAHHLTTRFAKFHRPPVLQLRRPAVIKHQLLLGHSCVSLFLSASVSRPVDAVSCRLYLFSTKTASQAGFMPASREFGYPELHHMALDLRLPFSALSSTFKRLKLRPWSLYEFHMLGVQNPESERLKSMEQFNKRLASKSAACYA